MQNIIKINQIKLYANHGCLKEEELIGGQYEINIELHTDFMEAAKNDDLMKTIDYVFVNKIVSQEMAIRSKLIEQVAYRIQNRFEKEILNLQSLMIEIVKISPPINGDVKSVSVIIKEKYN